MPELEIRQIFLTENACYKAGRSIAVKGIMVHSTGANNASLRRYIAPDDGVIGPNQYSNHWNQPYPEGRSVCVHGFIGKDKNGVVRVYQTLPWNMRGWHAGGGANDTHIGFEICEDDLASRTYFEEVYAKAVLLCAYLCEAYHLDPCKDGVLICHSEGYRRGIASNHGDVMHWWPRHGKTMDDFRRAVQAALSCVSAPDGAPAPAPETPSTGSPFKIGDVVWFSGGAHYKNSSAVIPTGAPKPGAAKITAVAPGAKHPYHVIHTDNRSAVYGWVDAEKVTAAVTGRTCTVAPGDSLWAISARQLGDGTRYTEIKSLNGLATNFIYAGQILKLPEK